MAMTSRSVARTLMAAAAATAPRSGARDIPRWALQRYLSAGGNLLAEEGKAADANYIKKEERKKLERLAQMGPCSEDPAGHTSATLGNRKIRPSMLDIMKSVEDNQYDEAELKHALQVLWKKCGPNKTLIEMELAMEDEALKGADNHQIDYVTSVSKEAILCSEIETAENGTEIMEEKYVELERVSSTSHMAIVWKEMKPVGVGMMVQYAFGKIGEVIKGGWGMLFRS